MWQITFASKTAALQELEHGLRVNENVLRWIIMKRRMLENLPNTYKVSRYAKMAEAKAQKTAAESQP